MDRGAWRATVHGVTRVRHDLATEPPPPPLDCLTDAPSVSGKPNSVYSSLLLRQVLSLYQC